MSPSTKSLSRGEKGIRQEDREIRVISQNEDGKVVEERHTYTVELVSKARRIRYSRQFFPEKVSDLLTGLQQTVKHFLQQWLEQVHKPSIREGSYVMYQSVLNAHVYPAIGHIQMQKLRPQQLQAFYASMTDEGLSAKTVHLIHAVLHKALDHAIK